MAQHIFDLNGRVAIVTGGTRGIGRAMAQGLAEAGARVVVTGRKAEVCENAARELTEASGGEVVGMACHMGDWGQIEALVERVYAELGRVDVLVNNAGINPIFMPVSEITREYWDKVYDVNLTGPMHLAGLLAPRMGESGGGSIVNVITAGAYNGGPGVGVYTSCKAALLNLTRVMAAEWASLGVRVNALAPGPFDTDMMRGAAKAVPEWFEMSANATMQKRVADPSEMVGTIVYLASDASSYVTGEDLLVAGGMLR